MHINKWIKKCIANIIKDNYINKGSNKCNPEDIDNKNKRGGGVPKVIGFFIICSCNLQI